MPPAQPGLSSHSTGRRETNELVPSLPSNPKFSSVLILHFFLLVSRSLYFYRSLNADPFELFLCLQSLTPCCLKDVHKHRIIPYSLAFPFPCPMMSHSHAPQPQQMYDDLQPLLAVLFILPLHKELTYFRFHSEKLLCCWHMLDPAH